MDGNTITVNGVVFTKGSNEFHIYVETTHNKITYTIFQNYGERWWWVCASSVEGGLRTLNMEPYRKGDDWLEYSDTEGECLFEVEYWMERVSTFINEGKIVF